MSIATSRMGNVNRIKTAKDKIASDYGKTANSVTYPWEYTTGKGEKKKRIHG